MYGALMRKRDDEIALAHTDALRASWARVFETETLDYVQRWQEALDQEGHNRNTRAHTGLTRAYTEYNRLRSVSMREKRPFGRPGKSA